MSNAYTGEEQVRIGGQDYTIVYDWRALGRIKTELGMQAIGVVMSGGDLEGLAAVLAIGLDRHHPGALTVERIIEASPPIMPTRSKVEKALNYAYWGPDGPPKAEKSAKQNPPERTATK